MNSESDSESESDDRPLFSNPARNGVKKQPVPKMESMKDSSDDSDDEPIRQAKKAEKPKAAKNNDDSSDDSEDDRPLFNPRNGSSNTRVKANKFLSDSSDNETLRIPRPRNRDSPASTKYNRKRKATPVSKTSKRVRTGTPKREYSSPKTPRSPRSDRVISVEGYPVKEKLEPLVSDKNAVRWWDKKPYKGDIKWMSLDHNGVVFPPPYQPHGVKLLYDGKPLDLTPEQEEMATFYAQMIETDWIKKKTFNKNFFLEFRRMLVNPDAKIRHPECTHFNKFNFRPIYNWCMKKKEADKAMKKAKSYKEKIKAEREKANLIYGYAIVDGVREKVGNFKVEPPGLFRGRGDHPKMGLLKKRLIPEKITINIGNSMPIPACPIPGHNWGGVVHDRTVTYIAKWIENINGQHKFVYLHASSRFKGQSDMAKYEKARELKKHIKRIRKDYEDKLLSKDISTQQLATCIWIIDKLSIRVGNEKDTDEEADTVGVCSFRVEHLKDFVQTADGKYTVTLDFLGKDSMQYLNTVEVPKLVWKNLKRYHNKPNEDSPLFETVDPSIVNEYLKKMMPGLSAKVFRTHNASTTLQQELSKVHDFQFADRVGDVTPESPEHEKKYFYDTCNKQVAILCNHKRTVNQEVFEKSEVKMREKIDKCEDDIETLENRLMIAQGKKNPRGSDEMKWVKKDPNQVKKQLEKKKSQLQKLKMDKQLKLENKEVALGTSKINYNDPRITVAFAKRMELPIEKVFNKALLDKFPWAMAASPDYVF